MKYIYTLLLMASATCASAQFQLNGGYSLSLPQQKMGDNINALHSLSVGGSYQLPGKLDRLQLGLDLGIGTYAMTSKDQTFNFGNGTSTRTNVNYSSNVLQGNFIARIMLLEDKQVLPYVSGKIGYASYYSRIFIEDPHDVDGCRPLDQRTLIKDGTWTTAYGGGVQINTTIFNKRNKSQKNYIDISVNSVRGSEIDYINTRKLIDASAPPPTGPGGKPLKVTFINATTQEIHEHQVAEVYTTPLRMLDFKISFVTWLGR